MVATRSDSDSDSDSSSQGSVGAVSSDTVSVDIGGRPDEEVDGPPAGTVFLFPTPDTSTGRSAVDVTVTVTVSAPGLPPRVLTKAVRLDDLQAGLVSVKFI